MQRPEPQSGAMARFRRASRLLRKTQFDSVLRHAAVRTARGPLRLSARERTGVRERTDDRAGAIEIPRLGLIVGKRMLRRAVDRNRAKRVIRESFRQAGPLPAMDIVVRLAVAGAEVSMTDADRLFAALVEIVERQRSEASQ